jgi:hypothetical protein
VAGDHELSRRVVVGRLDDLARGRLPTRGLDRGIVEAQHRGHRADTGRCGALHGLGPQPHERDGRGKVHRARTDEGRELAQAVTREHGRLHATAPLPGAPGRDAGDQHRGLRVHRRVQILGRAVLAQGPEIEAKHRGRFREGVGDERLLGREIRQHADRLGALSGEDHAERHAALLKKRPGIIAAAAGPAPAGALRYDRARQAAPGR